MKKTINILGAFPYIMQGGIETYYFEIMNHYNEHRFIYWIIMNHNKNRVRNEISNVKISQFFNYKNNYVKKHWFWKLQYAFSLRYRINKKCKKSGGSKWFISLDWLTILIIRKKFFLNNTIYLFQHTKLDKIPILRIGWVKRNIKNKLNLCSVIHTFSEYYREKVLEIFKNIPPTLFSWQTVIPKIIKNKSNKIRNIDWLFIGRDVPTKRLDKFTFLVSKAKLHLDVNCVVVGTKIKSIDSYKNLSRTDIFNKLNNTKFLVVTSDLEGQSLVIWEALSQNTQIIIFSNSKIYDFYRNVNGIHFVNNIEEAIYLLKTWKWVSTKSTLEYFRHKYSYFNNKYMN